VPVSNAKQLICRQAIETRYFGPTNVKGSRVKAECAAGSVTIDWASELNVDQNHYRAAWMLIEKLGWNKTSRVTGLKMGQLKRGSYVFVLVERKLK
jgi:hypothetical protein